MKNLTNFLSLFFLLLIFQSCITYNLPDGELKGKEVCGYNKCKPGYIGTVFHYDDNPYSPDISDESDSKSIAYSVLGHTLPLSDKTGGEIGTCSYNAKTPFSKTDITNIRYSNGHNLEYERSEKLELDVQAAVEADMNKLKNLITDQSLLNDLEGKITAAYNNVNDKELKISAKYSEWGLKNNAIDRFRKNVDFEDCKKYMKEQNHRLITAIGLVYYEIEYSQNSLSKIASEVQAELEQEGVNFNFGANFKREVSKNLTATTPGGYQVLVLRQATAEKLSL
ncbi:hypothetical protein APR41_04395 [Salegentibacter salinarum]|uniref:Lipoprotein n=1 Tax=Salegentibacter salinarum TaxID=447422 RepID=A0A2N0TUK7_9FLAO|nr:hypothetical protein [Salegentibacter salinarum]PKD18396.1 hypothetical protein APR41_04395 [Salegentibacter salinarum]SKB45068.1 hypothetical protein SAMN05660903_00902 [Salegentibacter salinarum]